MKQQQLLLLFIYAFIIIVAWIAFNLYDKSVTSTVTQEQATQTAPIDPAFNEQAIENYKQIKTFIKGTIAEDSPIIPISAQHNVNIDSLLKIIEEYIKTPKRDEDKDPLFYVARSFDINRPGTNIQNLKS